MLSSEDKNKEQGKLEATGSTHEQEEKKTPTSPHRL